jgi:hypothetical protein
MSTDPARAYPFSHVDGEIEFIVPGPRKPLAYNYDPGADAPPESVSFIRRTVLLWNVRETEPLSLDANGALLLRRPTAVRDFYDSTEVTQRYYPEAAEIIAAAVGAERVIVFDHNVRRGSKLAVRPGQSKPVQHAHTDFTPGSARRRARELLVAEGDDWTNRRFAQINLWRPIRGPLRDSPLGLCDGATVTARCLRATDLRYPNRTGEIFYLEYSPQQRWYFASDMNPDEVWLIKSFDSLAPGRVAPHSAFAPLSDEQDVLPRESIEARAFAFFAR